MAFTLWGLIFGDDGSQFVVPTYAQLREAAATQIRQLRGIANLVTNPGSFFGNLVDLVVTGVDVALQGAQQAVFRTLFTMMQGAQLDAFLADYLTRVQASATTVVAYAYGTAASAFNSGTILRTSVNGPAFLTDGNVVVPAPGAELAYAVEITAFAAGTFTGQPFTVTVAGFAAQYVPNVLDTGFSTRNGLVLAVNATILANSLSQAAYRGGLSPQNGRYALLVIEEDGGGPFTLTVAGPGGAVFKFPAVASPSTATILGPVQCPPEALRYLSLPAGVVGVTNPLDGDDGRERETDSQLRARHQIAQRGMGGGNPDAIRAILLSDPVVGGGGAAFTAVEYNPTDVVDPATGNAPHSVRAVVDQDADADEVALALWKAKAAGDNMNGPEVVIIADAVGDPQVVLIDRLTDVWIGVEITVEVGDDWPNTGDPLSQLRTDVAAYIEGLQPTANGGGVRVNLLPISTYPNGTERGVVNFVVRVGDGPAPAGPFTYRDYYPTIEPDANAASVLLTGRQKARCVVGDVSAAIV